MTVDQDFLEQLQRVKVSKRSKTRTVHELLEDLQSTKIEIPPYQRSFVWELDKQCRFIESLYMNIPIPPIFMLEKYNDSGNCIYEVIDGLQRLKTVANYCNNLLKLSNLETLVDLNQTIFNRLPQRVRNHFLARELDVVIIESE